MVRRLARVGLLLALAAAGAWWWMAGRGSAPEGASPPAGCGEGEAPVVVYFLRSAGAGGADGGVAAVTRCAPLAADTPEQRARAAVAALAAGPAAEERARGLIGGLPRGTEVRAVEFRRPWLAVDLSREVERVAGNAAVEELLAQLTWTLTEIPGVGGIELRVEGERVGTAERPFSPEGWLFTALRRPLGPWLRELGPARTLDVFIASIGDAERMWALSGPRVRAMYGSPEGIDVSAWSEGIGAWRAYAVLEERVDGARAVVTIGGPQRLEGKEYPDARYTAEMVREDGVWRFDGGRARLGGEGSGG